MGLLLCFLAVMSFSGFYLLVGHSQTRGCNPLALNFVIFCVGTITAVVAGFPLTLGHFPIKVVWVGSAIGFTAGLALLGIMMAVRSGIGVAIANTVASLSLALPIFLSMVFYDEIPTPEKGLGLVLAVAAIILVQRGRK